MKRRLLLLLSYDDVGNTKSRPSSERQARQVIEKDTDLKSRNQTARSYLFLVAAINLYILTHASEDLKDKKCKLST